MLQQVGFHKQKSFAPFKTVQSFLQTMKKKKYKANLFLFKILPIPATG